MPRAELLLSSEPLDSEPHPGPQSEHLEPEPEPEKEPEPEPEPGQTAWDAAWAGDSAVAASLRRLRSEFLASAGPTRQHTRRSTASPRRGAGDDVEVADGGERMSAEEWCRLAQRAGIPQLRGMRAALVALARRNMLALGTETLSFGEVASWYSTFAQRSTIAELDGRAAPVVKTRVWCCVLFIPMFLDVREGGHAANPCLRHGLSLLISALVMAVGFLALREPTHPSVGPAGPGG